MNVWTIAIAILLIISLGASGSPAGDLEHDVQLAFDRIGYESGWMDEGHRQFRAEFRVDYDSMKDGQISARVEEWFDEGSDGYRYKAVHRRSRPEQSPEEIAITYLRNAGELWKLERSDGDGELYAARVHPKIDQTRAIVPGLHEVSYFLGHVDDYPVQVVGGGLQGQEGEESRAIRLSFGADAPTMDYMMYLDLESGLPEKVEFLNTGFTVEIGKWIDFDGFMIPEHYRTTDLSESEDDPGVKLKVEKTVRLVATDFAPVFEADDFTIPADIRVLAETGFDAAR